MTTLAPSTFSIKLMTVHARCCAECKGTGLSCVQHNPKSYSCITCKGKTGYYDCTICYGKGKYIIACTHCHQTGTNECRWCHRGYLYRCEKCKKWYPYWLEYYKKRYRCITCYRRRYCREK